MGAKSRRVTGHNLSGSRTGPVRKRQWAAVEGLEARTLLAGDVFGSLIESDAGFAPMGWSTGDFNGDGELDLVVSSAAENKVGVMLGRGDGSFAAPSSYATVAKAGFVVSGDFNRDGNFDVAVASSGCLVVLSGRGDGTFEPLSTWAGNVGRWIISGDADGDGALDLLISNNGSNSTTVLWGDGTGSFTSSASQVVGGSPTFSAIADLNRDGSPDIVVVNSGGATHSVPGESFSVLFGNGNRTFASRIDYATGEAPAGLTIEDFDGNGTLDVAVANRNEKTLSVYLGSGDGTFAPRVNYAASIYPGDLVSGDFNGDGRTDLVSHSYYGGPSLFAGNGDGTFGPPTVYESTTLASVTMSGDFVSDGRSDLVLVNSTHRTVRVLPNISPTNFVPVASLVTPSGAQTGDVVVSYVLTDPESDRCSVDIHYSVDGGITWSMATAATSGDGLTGLESSSRGLVHTFVWDSSHDIVNANSSRVMIRIAPADSGSGLPAITDEFRVSNHSTRDPFTSTFRKFTNQANRGGMSFDAADFAAAFTDSSGGNDLRTIRITSLPLRGILQLGGLNVVAGQEIPAENLYLLTYAPEQAYLGKDSFGWNASDGGSYAEFGAEVEITVNPPNEILAAETTYAAGNGASAMTIGDFNGDSEPDLAVINYFDSTVSVLLGRGEGTFAPRINYPTGLNPGSIVCGDFTGDGILDLGVTSSNRLGIFPGVGDGTFLAEREVIAGGSELVTGDLDNDGTPDLAIPATGRVNILLGSKSGTKLTSSIPTTGGVKAMALRDVDADGRPDLVLVLSRAWPQESIDVWWGNGDGSFRVGPTMSYVGGGAAA